MHAERADVVIVGGGIIGSCVAYYLARAGRDVAVLDPAPGEGSSKANAGIICASYCLPMANPDSLRAGLAIVRGGHGPLSFRRPVPLRTLAWLVRRFGVRLPVAAGHGISLTLPAPGQPLISGARWLGTSTS